MKKQFTDALVEFLNAPNEQERFRIQQILVPIVKSIKLTFDNPEVEKLSKEHLLREINDFAITGNATFKSLLVTQLALFPMLIVD